MAGKRIVRSKKSIRSSRRTTKRRRVRVSHRPTIAGRRPAAVTRYSALRAFMVYPKGIKNDKNTPVKDSWLDQLYKYGLMALRLFMYVLAVPSTPKDNVAADWVFAITSVCQGFWLGIDDFIINSPISENITRFGKKYLAKFDYKQGRVVSFTVTVTPGSELSRRAGEYVVAVVLLSVEQSAMVVNPMTPPQKGVVFLPDEISFDDAMQYPDAVVSPSDKPSQITISTTGNAAEWHRIGHYIETPDVSDFPGGPPIAKLVIGYRDMSSTKPDADKLYSADEAMIQVSLTAKMCFREPGSCYIRTRPLRSMSEETAGVTLADGRKFDVPIETMTQKGALMYVPHSTMLEVFGKDTDMECV